MNHTPSNEAIDGFVKGSFAGLAIGVIFTMVFAAIVIDPHTRSTFELEAVREGHAEYVVNEKGEAIWKWKQTDKQKIVERK
jgi:hypothetical protein